MKLVFPAGGELGCSHALDSGDVPLQPSQSAPSISRLFFSSPFPNTLPSPFAPSKVYDPFPLRLRGPASFSCNTIPWWRRGRERGYTRKGARLGWGGGRLAGSALTQPSLPGATLSPASLQMLSAAAGGGEGPSAHQSRSLRPAAAPNPRAPRALFLFPSACHPPHLPCCSARGSAALPPGRRRGGEKGSGRSGERRQEEAVRLRGTAAARELPSLCARAPHRSSGGGRRAAGGAAGGGAARRAGGASSGRSEGGRARASRRAGERVASPPASVAAAFARSSDRRTDCLADRRGLSPWARGQLRRGSGLAARGFSARSSPPRLRRPRRARGWRCGSRSPPVGPRAAQPRPPRCGPELRPRSPAPLRAALSNGAPELQTRAAGASVFMNPEDVREALQGS